MKSPIEESILPRF